MFDVNMCQIPEQAVVINESGYTIPNERGEVFYYPQNPSGGLGGLVDKVQIIYIEKHK